MTQKKFIAAAVKAITEAPYSDNRKNVKCALLDMAKELGGNKLENKLEKALQGIIL